MHTTVMQFIVDLFEAGIDAKDEYCLTCCYHYESALPGYNEYFRKVRGSVTTEKRLAIVGALQKAGLSIEEMRQLLKVPPVSDCGPTDTNFLLGEWWLSGCISLDSLVQAVKNHYPDAS